MENDRVCIDTDVLIDNLRNRGKTVEYLLTLEEQKVTFATTTINAFELFYGAYKTKKMENIESVKKLLERLVVFEFDTEASEIAGKILAKLADEGKMIDFRDTLIGAIVLVNDYVILTRNVKHFKKIPGLRIIEPP